MTPRTPLLALVALLLLVPAAAAARPAPADGGTFTARVVVDGWARAAPARHGAPVLWVERRTPYSRRPQALLVTGFARDRRGTRWVRVQLPIRPNGAHGWVPARAVRLGVTRLRVVVRRGARRLEVWRGPHLLHRWPAGVGRPSTPTPLGAFAVHDPMRTLPGWRGVYGSHTLVLTAHSAALDTFMGGEAAIAVHGGPLGRVGAAASNGCVILAPGHLRTLAELVSPGVPVRVLP